MKIILDRYSDMNLTPQQRYALRRVKTLKKPPAKTKTFYDTLKDKEVCMQNYMKREVDLV